MLCIVIETERIQCMNWVESRQKPSVTVNTLEYVCAIRKASAWYILDLSSQVQHTVSFVFNEKWMFLSMSPRYYFKQQDQLTPTASASTTIITIAPLPKKRRQYRDILSRCWDGFVRLIFLYTDFTSPLYILMSINPNVYNVYVKWNSCISVYRFVLTTACADDDAVNRYFFPFLAMYGCGFSYWIVCYAIQYMLQDVLDLGLHAKYFSLTPNARLFRLI